MKFVIRVANSTDYVLKGYLASGEAWDIKHFDSPLEAEAYVEARRYLEDEELKLAVPSVQFLEFELYEPGYPTKTTVVQSWIWCSKNQEWWKV